MRELAILTFQTLDGVMQGPTSPQEDSSQGFTKGGWAMPYWAQVMEQVAEEAMAEPYDMLFGRTTYDMFAANWPNKGDESPVARMMNAARKYCVTSSPEREITWHNSEIVSGDVAAELANLKSQDGPLLQVHGSHGLIQTLLAQDLIDEYRLWTFPVLIGSGKRLFDSGTALRNLKLMKTRATPQGVVMTTYRHGD